MQVEGFDCGRMLCHFGSKHGFFPASQRTKENSCCASSLIPVQQTAPQYFGSCVSNSKRGQLIPSPAREFMHCSPAVAKSSSSCRNHNRPRRRGNLFFLPLLSQPQEERNDATVTNENTTILGSLDNVIRMMMSGLRAGEIVEDELIKRRARPAIIR